MVNAIICEMESWAAGSRTLYNMPEGSQPSLARQLLD